MSEFTGHNVPPWDYEPQGLINWELREGPRVLMSGCSEDLDAIAAHLARYIRPRRDQIFRMWDMANQLLLGWCNAPVGGLGMDVIGVRAAFRALEETRAFDPTYLYEMERTANQEAYLSWTS